MTYIAPGRLLQYSVPRGADFAPTDISGLMFWGAARLESFANNDPVGTWTDRSGNGNHATQATAGSKPTFKTNQVNGLAAIEFDGVNDWLQTGAFTLAWPVTMFMVLKQITWASGRRLCDGRAANSSLRARQVSSDPQLQPVASAGAATITGPTTGGAFGLVKIVWNGASSAAALNNAADTTGDIGTTATNADGITLADDITHGGSSSNISLAEVLVYNSAISGTNLTNVKNYLNGLYALY